MYGISYIIPYIESEERNMHTLVKDNVKFKIKYLKKNGEEARRFGIITDKCRGYGNRASDQRPFLHYYDLDKRGYRYATNWEII